MKREEDWEPGNRADELVEAIEGSLVAEDADTELDVDRDLAMALVLATLQVAREQRRTRLAIVELARVIVDELGRSPAP